MPANPKYLTKLKSQRFAKVSASILGGFLLTVAFHLSIAVWLPDKKDIWATYTFSLFIIWCALMLFPFLFENGWKCWACYGGITILLMVITFWRTYQ